MENPPTKAIYTDCTKEYLVLLSHCRTQERQLSGRGCTQNIWQAGESPPGVLGQRQRLELCSGGVGALLSISSDGNNSNCLLLSRIKKLQDSCRLLRVLEWDPSSARPREPLPNRNFPLDT